MGKCGDATGPRMIRPFHRPSGEEHHVRAHPRTDHHRSGHGHRRPGHADDPEGIPLRNNVEYAPEPSGAPYGNPEQVAAGAAQAIAIRDGDFAAATADVPGATQLYAAQQARADEDARVRALRS